MELADGTIDFTARDQLGPSTGTRAYSTSSDAGESFDADFQIDPTILSPVCQGSILRYTGSDPFVSDDRILQSYPYFSSREQIAVRSSFDEAGTWTIPKVIYEGSSAYADLVQTADDGIGLLYERDNYTKITFAGFTTEWLDEGIVEEPDDISDGTFYGFWTLDQPSGQTVADSSGYARDGRLGDDNGADGADPSWVNDAERGWVASFEKGDLRSLKRSCRRVPRSGTGDDFALAEDDRGGRHGGLRRVRFDGRQQRTEADHGRPRVDVVRRPRFPDRPNSTGKMDTWIRPVKMQRRRVASCGRGGRRRQRREAGCRRRITGRRNRAVFHRRFSSIRWRWAATSTWAGRSGCTAGS